VLFIPHPSPVQTDEAPPDAIKAPVCFLRTAVKIALIFDSSTDALTCPSRTTDSSFNETTNSASDAKQLAQQRSRQSHTVETFPPQQRPYPVMVGHVTVLT
jgi:hypothetical protein